MADREAIIERTRLEIADLRRPFYRTLTATGFARLDLQEENISTLFLYPRETGIPFDPETYRVETDTGRVFFDEPPEYGTVVIAEGESSKLFTDDEIRIFVDSAFLKHTNERMPAVSMANLPPVEEHLVSILAKIEALWVLMTSAAFDINIHAPEGMFVPRAQRFEQLRALLQMTEQQYKDLCNALGVGLYTIKVGTLRRVSRQTGRLVPIFLPQEIDDTRPAQRVYPPVDSQGANVAQDSVMAHDLQVFQGRPFSETFSLLDPDSGEAVDLLAFPDFEATLYRDKHAAQMGKDIIPEFEVEVDDAEGSVTISLTAEQTKKLESTGVYVWDLRWMVDADEDSIGLVLMSGKVLVEAPFPYRNVNVQVTRA